MKKSNCKIVSKIQVTMLCKLMCLEQYHVSFYKKLNWEKHQEDNYTLSITCTIMFEYVTDL